MRRILPVLLLALLVCYGIHFNVVREQDAARIAERDQIIEGLELRNEKLGHRLALVETRAGVRDYFDTRGVNLNPRELKAVSEAILDVSDRYRLSPDLIIALIETESSFDKNAVSEKGAVGLMQLLPSTAADVARDLKVEWDGAHQLRDPELNIEMGAFYLNQLIERFDDIDLALAAYNMGPGRVEEIERLGMEKPKRYARSVYGKLQTIERIQ
jgi:soluble lytic murein transglycosylase